jgi:ABC-type microcin C transport system permease subunit YejB
VLLGITAVVFVVLHASGDPAALYMGPEGTKQDYEILRSALGFDRPLPEQYGLFLWRAAHGDFGRSLRHQQPALPMVLSRLPATFRLAAAAMILALLLALPLGILSALYRRSLWDTGGMMFALTGQCSSRKALVVHPVTVAVEMVQGGIRTKHTFSGIESRLDADTMVLAFGGKANDTLFHEISAKVPGVKLVGDACSPRRIHDVLLEGTRVARAI